MPYVRDDNPQLFVPRLSSQLPPALGIVTPPPVVPEASSYLIRKLFDVHYFTPNNRGMP